MGWLDNIFPPPSRKGQKFNLPSIDVRDVKLPAAFRGLADQKGGQVPNASLVYGIGSAVLFTAALYSLFTGAWLTSFLLLIPAGALFGFALHYLRHGS